MTVKIKGISHTHTHKHVSCSQVGVILYCLVWKAAGKDDPAWERTSYLKPTVLTDTIWPTFAVHLLLCRESFHFRFTHTGNMNQVLLLCCKTLSTFWSISPEMSEGTRKKPFDGHSSCSGKCTWCFVFVQLLLIESFSNFHVTQMTPTTQGFRLTKPDKEDYCEANRYVK